jgi:aconitate hydratase
MPQRFTIDDSMITRPDGGGEIVRGPNIGDPPKNEACPDTINGVVGICLGDKITTDDIMPAGNRLKYRSNIPKYAEYVFERQDPQFASRALAHRKQGLHTVIVAGESYGQGSSREHAAICPMYLGVKMIIVRSMERIHRANLINFGIIPAIFTDVKDYANIARDDRFVVKNVREALQNGLPLAIENITRRIKITVTVELSEREKRYLLAGGLINATRG